MGEEIIYCDCHAPVKMAVSKDGREYFACANNRYNQDSRKYEGGCKFFKWADVALAPAPQKKPKSGGCFPSKKRRHEEEEDGAVSSDASTSSNHNHNHSKIGPKSAKVQKGLNGVEEFVEVATGIGSIMAADNKMAQQILDMLRNMAPTIAKLATHLELMGGCCNGSQTATPSATPSTSSSNSGDQSIPILPKK
jgi:hypothetical protein